MLHSMLTNAFFPRLNSIGCVYIKLVWKTHFANVERTREDEASCLAMCSGTVSCGVAVVGEMNGGSWCFLKQLILQRLTRLS